ncbi:hypothetical protein ACVW00_003217 [Marmoricola sp. URHA0025 HA25]
MNKLNRAGKTFSTVIAGAVVIALFGTGTAVAGGLITSAKIKNNTVKSIDVRDGNLKGVDVADGSLSGADVADGSLNDADVADGTLSGADIADGSLSHQDVGVFFVTVEADGTVNASSGGVSVSNTATGEYRVDFNRPVASCAFTATVGDPTSAAVVHGEADVTAQFLLTDNVHVYTRTAGSATLADQPFQLTAVC